MTGPAAYFGLPCFEAAELYFNEVNAKGGVHGRKIRFLTEDDACQPIKGVASVNKLLAEKVFMIYGLGCSGVALAALDTILREGIPTFVLGSTGKLFARGVHRNIFRAVSIPDDLQAILIADYDVNNLHATRIAVIHDANEYGKGGADGIITRLGESQLKPVAVESYNTGDTDFTPQILKVREAKPEVVNLYGYAKEAAIIARQAKELGLNAQFIISASAAATAFFEGAGDAAIGYLCVYPANYLVDSPEPLVVEHIGKMKANYRLGAARPNYSDFQGIGAAMVITEGFRRAGKDLTWEKFINGMESIKDFKTGFLPSITFSSDDHNGQKSGKLLVVLPGKKLSVLNDELVLRKKVEKKQ
jgi:branched-chain amino acid transport system substrate-binding protein